MRIRVRSLAALADDLVAGGMRDQMGEAFDGDGVAIADVGLNRFGERGNSRHWNKYPGCLDI